MTYDYAIEKLSACVYALATGAGPLPARLGEVTEHWVRLEPKDFPEPLRIDFARIDEALGAAGEIRSTVAQFDADRAADVARQIYELYESGLLRR